MNWTKVGLKVISLYIPNTVNMCLNWTKVGLKDQVEDAHEHPHQRLNWTKVGLKVIGRMIGASRSMFELD